MCDRPAREDDSEIEVTPEMIEAGVRELWRYDAVLETDAEGVLKIFRSMYALLPRPCATGDSSPLPSHSHVTAPRTK